MCERYSTGSSLFISIIPVAIGTEKWIKRDEFATIFYLVGQKELTPCSCRGIIQFEYFLCRPVQYDLLKALLWKLNTQLVY
jgi:hypothetical protein